MPSPQFARELANELPAWEHEGLVSREQAAVLAARYPAPAAGALGESVTSTLLYGVAGALLGAAALAFVQVGLRIEDAMFPLLALGVALFGVGVALRVFVPRIALLGDTFLAAGLLPIAFATFPREANDILSTAVSWIGLAFAVGTLWWRREGTFVPVFALVATSALMGRASVRALGDHWMTYWLVGQLALAGALIALDILVRKRENVVLGALAVAGLAAPLVLTIMKEIQPSASTGTELIFGAVVLAGLVASAYTRRRGSSIGFGAALAIDAIVFAFDIGGVLTGTVTLVAVAGLLIWQAEVLKRFFSA